MNDRILVQSQMISHFSFFAPSWRWRVLVTPAVPYNPRPAHLIVGRFGFSYISPKMARFYLSRVIPIKVNK